MGRIAMAEKSDSALQRDYQRIEQALHFISSNYQSQPDLAEIAASVHLSEAHFQRLFKSWAGVSPKQFMQYLTLTHAQKCLSGDMPVLDAALDSGLVAPARLNELFVRLESVTPTEFKQKGRGIEIAYGFHPTAFGECLIGVTERGVSALEFCLADDREQTLGNMIARMPEANYRLEPKRTEQYRDMIFMPSSNKPQTLSLLVRGTAFQIKVWEALLRIPTGARTSYGQLAAAVGSAGASRAVGTAVGKNPVAVLIPCHRVIRENGLLGGYRWGLQRKLALLGVESMQRYAASELNPAL